VSLCQLRCCLTCRLMHVERERGACGGIKAHTGRFLITRTQGIGKEFVFIA
jgi:hypothetical protein